MKAHLSPVPPRLDSVIVENTRAFAALEDEWEDLYRNSPLATPFQSWAWLYSWWEFYGEGHYELRLIVIRDETGLLVGLMPLMMERRRGFGRLLFVGTGQTDHLDVLVRKGWEAQVAEAGRIALRSMGSWRLADLQELRPEAAAWNLFRRWEGPQAHIWQADRSMIDTKPWDELLMSLHQKLRSNVRRALRRVEADGVRCELASVDNAEQAAQRLVALSREQWRERWKETSPEHWTWRFEAHLEAVARRMTACDLGGISEFRRDGEVILSHFLVFGKDFIGKYMIGAGQKALQRYQFSSLGIWDALQITHSRNSSRIDLGRGEESYKLQWRSRTIPNYRLVLGRSVAHWSLYAGYHALRSKIIQYVRSEDAPEWLKEAETKYRRTLRYTVTWYVESKSTPQWIKSIAANWLKGRDLRARSTRKE